MAAISVPQVVAVKVQLLSHSSCNAVIPLTAGHWSWTASVYPGNGMALLRTAGTGARELHLHHAPSSFFMPTCSSLCTRGNLPVAHAVCRGSICIKKWACSLVPAFPRNISNFTLGSKIASLTYLRHSLHLLFYMSGFSFPHGVPDQETEYAERKPFLCLIFQPDVSQTLGPTEPRKWEWASHLGKCGIHLDGH